MCCLKSLQTWMLNTQLFLDTLSTGLLLCNSFTLFSTLLLPLLWRKPLSLCNKSEQVRCPVQMGCRTIWSIHTSSTYHQMWMGQVWRGHSPNQWVDHSAVSTKGNASLSGLLWLLHAQALTLWLRAVSDLFLYLLKCDTDYFVGVTQDDSSCQANNLQIQKAFLSMLCTSFTYR